MSEESKAEAEAFSARPEARFALAAGLLGALAATGLTVVEVARESSAASAVAYVYLPLVAICAAVLSGVWGIALGCVWLSLQGRRSYYRAVLLLAWMLVIAVPATLAWALFVA